MTAKTENVNKGDFPEKMRVIFLKKKKRERERNKDLEVESNSCPLQAIEIDIITLKGYKAFLSVDES